MKVYTKSPKDGKLSEVAKKSYPFFKKDEQGWEMATSNSWIGWTYQSIFNMTLKGKR